MNVREICRVLDDIAPLQLAADWDNVGLLIGDGRSEIRRLMLCIDLTRDVLEEVRRCKAGMVLAYHPVIFKSLKRLTAEAAPIAWQAARMDLAVYSPHTALDAVEQGTNDVLADVLGLEDRRPLDAHTPDGRRKLVVYAPPEDAGRLAQAAFDSGAGQIGEYSECSFAVRGVGTFTPGDQANPAVGQQGQHESVEEMRLEITAPADRTHLILETLRMAHRYEEPVIDVYSLDDEPGPVGMGRVGRLRRPVKLATLLGRIKKALGLRDVLLADRSPEGKDRMVGTAAVAAGSAGRMWRSAVAAGASLYLTGEMRHHDALAATAAGLSVVCVGHSNSERITLGRLAERLTDSLEAVAVQVSETDRDPFCVT